MGQRGPRPQPAEILRLTGSHHTSDRKDEIPILPGEPEPPDWFDDRHLAHWERLTARLRNQNILSESWREPLTTACEAWVEYEALVMKCRDEPYTVMSEKGGVYVNPMYGMKNKAWDRVVKISKEFGFTPASKTGIRTEPGQAKNRKGYIKRA